MSLVGSLQDLGLGDILQIVSLSRKSGLLLLRSDAGEGRIVFRDGQVRAAFVKGEPEDLHALLVGRGFASQADFERAESAMRLRGLTLDDALAEETGLGRERLESLRREHVEGAVLRMFTWLAGEFSFEVGGEIGERDAQLMLPSGINAQYLTMEATRIGDERAGPAPGPSASAPRAADDGLVFSGDAPAAPSEPKPRPRAAPSEPRRKPTAPPSAGASLAAAVAPRIPAEGAAPADAAEVLAFAAARASESEESGAAASLVVIDPDLTALEWLKQSLQGLFARIHIFQRTDLGIARVRQYLARAELPVVLISPRAPGDPVSGVTGLAELIRGLRAPAPRLPVLVLTEEGDDPPRGGDAAEALVARPPSHALADLRRWPRFAKAAERLRENLEPWARAERTAPRLAPATPSPAEPALARLRELSHHLQDPARRGEVLSLVLEFAAERFPRVAMFMVRDDEAVGIAQRGLARAGGPDDRAFRELVFAIDECEGLRSVVEQRRAVRGAPSAPGDRRLAERLGAVAADEVYVAPILGGDRVVALLYADTLPEGGPLGDTTALEIVLHEAGLALDRALLERALEELRAREGPPR
jgi:hypothetical protein